MGRLFVAESTLDGEVVASVNDVREDIDVFVSHKSEDEDKALEVANCVKLFGLTAWIDVTDMKGVVDNANVVRRIEDAISHASSLIAVVTRATRLSWWVPFEIGLAYQKKKQLASYCEEATKVTRPSFLWPWPLIEDHYRLHMWCEHVKETKTMGNRIVAEAAATGRRQSYRDSLRDIRKRLRS